MLRTVLWILACALMVHSCQSSQPTAPDDASTEPPAGFVIVIYDVHLQVEGTAFALAAVEDYR